MLFSTSFPPIQLMLTMTAVVCFICSSSPAVLCTSENANKYQQNKNSSSGLMDPHELEILYTVMETLSSDQHWRVSYPNPCHPGSSWPGIGCKFTSIDNLFHVTRLDFGTSPNPSCKNSARFPSEIFQLSHLESIFIFRCFSQTLTGIEFPTNTGMPFASPIQQLSLRSNPALMGTIPPLLSSLKSLQILTLSQNMLTGKIPVQIFSLKSLVHLDLSYNRLSGEIPWQVGNLVNLVGLDLSYNGFTGPIPSTMGNLQILQKLDLSSNSLNGTVPATIGELRSLVFLAVSKNRLSGDFSRALSAAGLQNLQYFLMDDNPVFVSLPAEFGNLSKVQELRLSNSGYSGSIPSSYSQLTNLSTLSLQNNRLSGQIPAGLANLTHIYHMNLSRNFLDGVVPFNTSFLKRLGRNLDLRGNPGLCLSPSAGGDGADIGVDICWGRQKKLKNRAMDELSSSISMLDHFPGERSYGFSKFTSHSIFCRLSRLQWI